MPLLLRLLPTLTCKTVINFAGDADAFALVPARCSSQPAGRERHLSRSSSRQLSRSASNARRASDATDAGGGDDSSVGASPRGGAGPGGGPGGAAGGGPKGGRMGSDKDTKVQQIRRSSTLDTKEEILAHLRLVGGLLGGMSLRVECAGDGAMHRTELGHCPWRQVDSACKMTPCGAAVSALHAVTSLPLNARNAA